MKSKLWLRNTTVQSAALGSASQRDGEDAYSCGISHEALEGKLLEGNRMHNMKAGQLNNECVVGIHFFFFPLIAHLFN